MLLVVLLGVLVACRPIPARPRPVPRPVTTTVPERVPCPGVCGPAYLPEPDVPADGGPVRVLLFGDSLLRGIAPGLVHLLPGVQVRSAAVSASSPIETLDFGQGEIRVADYLAERLQAIQPDLVVFEYSGNCHLPCQLPYASPEFFTAWAVAVRELDDLARASGATTLWILPPPRHPEDTGNFRTFGRIYLAMGQPTVSWVVPLTAWGVGPWVKTLAFDEQGDYRTIRLPPGLHFTQEGNRRAAIWTAAAIRKIGPVTSQANSGVAEGQGP